jgi:hypothetical protein
VFVQEGDKSAGGESVSVAGSKGAPSDKVWEQTPSQCLFGIAMILWVE